MVAGYEVLFVLKRIVLFSGGVLVVLFLLFVAVGYAAFPLLRYISRPKDPALAASNGRALARVHGETIVAVVGHPDDAEFYIGGTLATLVRNGNRLVLIDGTSGEKGGNLPNLAQVREEEQRRAGKIIGYSRIVFLRNPDRGLVNDARVRRQLSDIFEQEKPSILITFDAADQMVGYRHTDHRAAGAASLEVAEDFPTFREAYLFSSASPNVLVEVAPVAQIKGDASSQHRSQTMGSSWPRVLLRFFMIVPRRSTRSAGAGFTASYPEVGIKYGEPFRLVRISHER